MFYSNPCIGSQLFINHSTSTDEARTWVESMHRAGLKLIRLFILWDHVEPAPGKWDFTTYDAVFDTAEPLGMGVVPTLMSVSPPGWTLRTGGPQSVADLEDPDFIRQSEHYIETVVNHWADHPALHSWILWNEASRIPPRTPAALRKFRDYLEARFAGDLAALNRTLFQTYASFDDIGAARTDGAVDLEFSGFADKVYWQEFAVSELCAHLHRIAHHVRTHDANHPVHVNPHGLGGYVQHAGQSVWREAACVDFLGCSSHPVWHATRFGRDRWLRSLGIFADLMRSATPHPDGLFWVTELQGGTTLHSADSADCPAPDEVERWLWEGIGAGAKASIFWCFNWRDEGFEAGEWHLTRLDGSPSPRLRAATRVARALERHADWFRDSRPYKPAVYILRSDAAERLAWVERQDEPDPRDPRNRMRPADSACGAALLLADLGIETGYVEESGLAAFTKDPDNRNAVLIAPGLEALSDGTLETLIPFVRNGGHFIADGAVGWKQPTGHLALERQPHWKALFGVPLVDVEAFANARVLPNDQHPPAPWGYRVITDSETDDTGPLHRHDCGAGSARWIRTWFFHRFLIDPAPASRTWFQSLLPDSVQAPVRLAQPGPGSRLRLLNTPKGFTGILIDENGNRILKVTTSLACQITLETGETHRVKPSETIDIQLNKRGLGLLSIARRTSND
ncbi:MAG: beta-galactosidase [Verrucomicrobia bacterium]|nr:beta-galactosidase [Verrucomicrobiota bacterium]MCH8527962.1 beta-galactosidase [Kiritimatiellia bacterium]